MVILLFWWTGCHRWIGARRSGSDGRCDAPQQLADGPLLSFEPPSLRGLEAFFRDLELGEVEQGLPGAPESLFQAGA
jgi:hypothetical protein